MGLVLFLHPLIHGQTRDFVFVVTAILVPAGDAEVQGDEEDEGGVQ